MKNLSAKKDLIDLQSITEYFIIFFYKKLERGFTNTKKK